MRINDVFPDWLTGGGIFSALQTKNVPWVDENISDVLDILYHGNISGDKLISPLVSKLSNDEELTLLERDTLADVLISVYGKNWVSMWDTMLFEYNPIENYRMVEEMTDDETVIEYGKESTRTDNLNHAKTGTETLAPDTTEIVTPDLTTTTENSVNGFNSDDASPSDNQSEVVSGSTTTTKEGTETTTFNTSDSNTGTQKVSDTGSDTHTRNYLLTRSGNIGVTTSQQMIQSERDLWIWNYFNNVIFPDIDRVLTLMIY